VPPVNRRPITFEDLQRVQGKVEQERQSPNRYDQTRGRRYIFNEALNAGDLDRILYETQDLNSDFSDYDPELFDEGSPELRRNADITEFGNEIPFRGQNVDPDYNEFDLANIAAAQPNQALDFLNSRIVSPETAQSVYEGFSRASNDERNAIRLALQRGGTTSDIYSNFEGDERGQILDEVNRSGRGESNAPSIAELYEPVNQISSDLRDEVTFVQEQMDFQRRGGRELASAGAALNVPFSPGVEQQRLDFVDEIDPRESLLAEGARIIDRPPASFEDYVANNNRLVTLGRDLSAIRRNASPRRREQRIDQVLPAIIESPRGQDIVNEITGAVEGTPTPSRFNTGISTPPDVDQERFTPGSSRLNFLRRWGTPDDAERMRRSLEFSPAEMRNTLGDLEQVSRRTGQLVIPELQNKVMESFDEDALNRFAGALKQYPEMIPLLSNAPRTTAPVGGKEEISKYSKFIDSVQQVSDPKDRADIYNSLMTEGGVAQYDLAGIEFDYTSGSTERQQRAIERLSQLNPEAAEKLSRVSSPAASTVRPLIGGGKYVGRDDPEARELMSRIDDRARVFKKAFDDLSPQAKIRLFDKYAQSVDNPTELYVRYNPDTDEVTPAKIDDIGEIYGLSMTNSPPMLPRIADSTNFSGDISENALKFLAKNPILGTSSISFQTLSPDENRFTYDAKDLPPAVSKAFTEFVSKNALAGMPPGTLVVNKPLQEFDLEEAAERKGDASSTFRKQQEVIGTPANKRGVAYQRGGFGPMQGTEQAQYAYINKEGKVIPLQLKPAETPIRGQLSFSGGQAKVNQSSLPSNKTYYAVDPVMGAAAGALEMGRAIKRTPASLLPGAADLIPSPEAIQTGYKQGPAAMGKQMGREFIESLPTGAAFAAALSTPVLAPAAPGVGLGFIGSAAARAANEVVRQETGEGIVPKVRQLIGTAPRSGVASKTPLPNQPLTAEIKPLSDQSKTEMIRRQNRNELQRRADLVKERFNPTKGEFGLSELLFGR
jgi:hypothetical protein